MKKSIKFICIIMLIISSSSLLAKDFSKELLDPTKKLLLLSGEEDLDGGGLVGDGSEMLTLKDGKKVLADFVIKFERNKTIPKDYKEVKLKEDYPEIFNEYQKLKSFIEDRVKKTIDIRLKLIPMLENFKFYTTPKKLICENKEKEGYVYGDDVINKSVLGCAFITKVYDREKVEVVDGNVIVFNQSDFNSNKISNRVKALAVIHEILHHILASTDMKKRFPDSHMVIFPFTKNLYYSYLAFLEQKKSFEEDKSLQELDSDQLQAIETFQYALLKVVSLKGYYRTGYKFFINKRGGGFVRGFSKDSDVYKNDSTNFISVDSAVNFTYYDKNDLAHIQNNTIISSVVNVDAIMKLAGNTIVNSILSDGIGMSKTTFENNDLIDSKVVLVRGKIESTRIIKSNIGTTANVNIKNSLIRDVVFKCKSVCQVFEVRNSKIMNSRLDKSDILRISDTEIYKLNATMSTVWSTGGKIFNTTFRKVYFKNYSKKVMSILNSSIERTKDRRKEIVISSESIKNVTIENLNIETHLGDLTITISKNSLSKLNFNKNLLYEFETCNNLDMKLSNIPQFEKDFFRAGNAAEEIE